MTTISTFMRRALILALIAAFILITAFAGFRLLWKPQTRADVLAPILWLNDAAVETEFARTSAEKIRGLSGRAALAENNGMLFINAADDFHPIWMKDMRFPIDIIWIAADGRIIDIKPDAAPESYPEIFRPRERARFVLEVASGFTQRHHVNIGDSAKLPGALY